MPSLKLTHSASFLLPPSWESLPTQPSAMNAEAWQAWERATRALRSDGDGFDWMEGLASAETQALSNEALAVFDSDQVDDGCETLRWPLDEIAASFAEVNELPWTVWVCASCETADTLWFVDVSGDDADMESEGFVDRIMDLFRMTRGDCGPGPEPGPPDYHYDPKGVDAYFEYYWDLSEWTEWGMTFQFVRLYYAQQLVVMASGPEHDRVRDVLDENLRLCPRD